MMEVDSGFLDIPFKLPFKSDSKSLLQIKHIGTERQLEDEGNVPTFEFC